MKHVTAAATLLLGGSAALLLAGPAALAGQDVTAVGAWARATAASAQTGAVYLTIVDKGAADRLVSVDTPVAASATLHETVKTGDVVGMKPVSGLPVSGAGPVMLAPGGYHVMLLGLKGQLVKGRSFPLTLTFEKAGKVETTVRVEAADAGGPTQDAGPGHDMDTKANGEH